MTILEILLLVINDSQHYALSEKFWRDYADETRGLLPTCPPDIAALVEQEESNNANRDAWDRTYTPLAEPVTQRYRKNG